MSQLLESILDSTDAEENHKRIIQLKEEAMRSFILLGKELKLNKDRRHFESLGHLTFEAYIESPMVGLGRRSVYSLITIYETFVEKLGYSLEELSAVDYSKLDRIIPAINVQPVAHREWFERAKTLPRRDLEREVREVQESQTKRMSKPSAPELPDNGLEDWLNTIQCGECLELLQQLPDESIDTILTSPPYYGLRDYGVEGQLGLEPTLDEFLEKMLAITAELKRVLKKTGTLWWNHGDSYGGSGMGVSNNATGKTTLSGGKNKLLKLHNKSKESWNHGIRPNTEKGYEKCLSLQAHRLVIRMIDEQEWILRNTIIWHKPNCMPSSVEDRFTVDYEPVFFFSKSEKYYFERQFEPHETKTFEARQDGKRAKKYREGRDKSLRFPVRYNNPLGRNKRSVWKIPTQPFPEAHFAVFPEALCETPIKAGCPEFICRECGVAREKILETVFIPRPTNDKPESYRAIQEEQKGNRSIGVVARQGVGYNEYENKGYTDCGCNAGFESGIVLDPFCGSGTTLVVASKLKRKYLGFEINPDYVEIARRRLQPV